VLPGSGASAYGCGRAEANRQREESGTRTRRRASETLPLAKQIKKTGEELQQEQDIHSLKTSKSKQA
jgi:hypothetical protein